MLVAKIKSGTCPEYLTEGKEYEASRIEYGKKPYGRGFTITDDQGDEIYCCEFKSEHLHGGSWELYEKPSLPFAASDGEKGEMPVEVV
jgi:hypothetical protein